MAGGVKKAMTIKDKITLSDITVPKDRIESVVKNNDYNRLTMAHYDRLFKEKHEDKLIKKKMRMKECNSFWQLDKYEIAKIKDYKKTNLCDDKFCNNCKKVKQASRAGKFIPLLEPYSEDMYLMTLTVPNISGDKLGVTIDKMFKSFATLIEYLKGKKKIRGIDFEAWGYQGAIRSLEVTYKKVKKGRGFMNSYHPHIHAMIVLENGLGNRDFENVFSHDFLGKRELRKFSNEEILLQGIWRLLNEGKRVTLKAIEALDKGYSCRLDKAHHNDYMEIFKYMTKATSEDEQGMEYLQFKDLYYALMNKRQIQGYGCFFNLKDEDVIDSETVDSIYDELIEELKQKENPVEVLETPTELLKDKDYTLISRKQIYKFLKDIKD